MVIITRADLITLADSSSESSSSCGAGGSTSCHSQAQCVDYDPGYCCQCSRGYFGNGRVCLTDGNNNARNRIISLLFAIFRFLRTAAFIPINGCISKNCSNRMHRDGDEAIHSHNLLLYIYSYDINAMRPSLVETQKFKCSSVKLAYMFWHLRQIRFSEKIKLTLV